MSSPYRENARVENEKPEPFPLEKILTMSAQDYVGPGVRVTDKYEVRGVHCMVIGHVEEKPSLYITAFALRVPPHTEVVVDRHITIGRRESRSDIVEISGTALIPKPQGTTEST